MALQASGAKVAVCQPALQIDLTSSLGNCPQQPLGCAARSVCVTGVNCGSRLYRNRSDQTRANPVDSASLNYLKSRSRGASNRSAFNGRALFNPKLICTRRCKKNWGSFKKGVVKANAPDGIHLDARGLVVLEEETTLTQQEWEEAKKTVRRKKATEQWVERVIFNCRFFTLAGVAGSLLGSLLCFLKGSYYVVKALQGYIALMLTNDHTGKVVMKLIEALDTYLVGTVMLIFGMGLYELFVMKLDAPAEADHHSSSLFGLFHLQERPTWLAINGLDDLKTKLGHVIVMILLVGMFEKSKKVHPTNSMDLFLTAGSVLMCAGSLFLLNRLNKR